MEDQISQTQWKCSKALQGYRFHLKDSDSWIDHNPYMIVSKGPTVTDWFRNHVYVATWLSLLVTLWVNMVRGWLKQSVVPILRRVKLDLILLPGGFLLAVGRMFIRPRYPWLMAMFAVTAVGMISLFVESWRTGRLWDKSSESSAMIEQRKIG